MSKIKLKDYYPRGGVGFITRLELAEYLSFPASKSLIIKIIKWRILRVGVPFEMIDDVTIALHQSNELEHIKYYWRIK